MTAALVTPLAAVALAFSAAQFWIAAFQVYGTSMQPTLAAGDVVVALRGGDLESGGVVACDYNGKILMRRVVAVAGDLVSSDANGDLLVNGKELEPAVSACVGTDTSALVAQTSYPLCVPSGSVFVVADTPSESATLDSRVASLGCVSTDDVVGTLVLRVWPLGRLGVLG